MRKEIRYKIKKYLVSCIAVLTFALIFVWLALPFSVVDSPIKALNGSTSGYDILKAGTSEYASSAENARYVFMLLTIIFGGITVLAACGQSLQAAKMLKVKCNLGLVVACLLCFTALLAVAGFICGICIEIPDAVKDYVKIGFGNIALPAFTVVGAALAFVFKSAK